MCLLQPYNYTQAPSLTLTMRNHSSQKPATDIIEQPNDYQYKFSIQTRIKKNDNKCIKKQWEHRHWPSNVRSL